jgi:hypothetical protein
MEVDFGDAPISHPTKLEGTFDTMDIFYNARAIKTLNIHIPTEATMPPTDLNALVIFGVIVNVDSKILMVGINMDIRDLTLI